MSSSCHGSVCKTCDAKWCYPKWILGSLLAVAIFFCGTAVNLWESAPEEINGQEWKSAADDTTLRFANGHAHFINAAGHVVAIYPFENLDENVWASVDKDRWGDSIDQIFFSKIGEELHVKEKSDDSIISGVYVLAEPETPDIVLPIDLAEKNKMDINITLPRELLEGFDGKKQKKQDEGE